MILKSIFNKPVDRPIEGVIKADDAASLRLEIEEYVLTNEVERCLESFLDAYNHYEGANGVWVSGFFGSGKSHLLKMLALLLENRQVDGVAALDLFLPKCGDNEILRGGLQRAVSIPSRSILFNIDQKADVISKTQIDALLAVFVKVFDEMCGYYGKQGHIAQFERDLDSRGLYDQFKTTYQVTSNRTWQKGREQALLESKNIAQAYAQVADVEPAVAIGILDKYRAQYRVSIEDFAAQVNAYIEREAPNFRLNFFVDEVGQYIADNVKLMTNLQTIAESLATKCRGRAWIMVTAQEDMGAVVGEMGKQQGNDFSKIQARFSNRMKLTSQDVAEVIQKRLLMKNDVGVAQVSELYHAQKNNVRTLFDFADGGQAYQNFQDLDHFVHSYPFIPYQFALFQSAIQNLSQHNAFEGKHSSVGERSMLGVFQQVAIQIGDHEIGQLATFDLMFEGIRTALKSQIQKAVLQAETHLGHPFAVRLLKALFLVKYVKEFKPTVRNLSVLMLERFNSDLPTHKKQVEEALSLLEQQTYIQRTGEQYEYLTDEEKDIEEEVKNTEVDSADVAAELEKIIFDGVIKQRKIRYDAATTAKGQAQDYSFARKLDDRLYGRDSELAIHVISPFHEHAENEEMLRTNSAYNVDELFVLLPVDDRLVRDLLMYKRTDKYVAQNISITQREAVKRILADKQHQNNERYADIQQRVQQLVGKAKLIVAGTELDMSSQDAQTRIIRGFHDLVSRAYPNLRMLRGVAYTESMVRTLLTQKGGSLLSVDSASLSEAEQEVLAFIQTNNRSGVRTTLKSLIERFERKPYGWYYAAILCILASLCVRGKVEVRIDSHLLEEDALEKALLNSHAHGNVMLQPQVEFTASQVRGLKAFFEDFFDTSPQSNEAKALGKETSQAFQDLVHQLNPLMSQVASYPFLSVLRPVIATFQALIGKPYTWYLTELTRDADSLLDVKESVLDPIRKFMNGSQKDIYDAARRFMQEQADNFMYVDSVQSQHITNCLSDANCFKGNRVQLLKTQVDNLTEQVRKQVHAETQQAFATVAELQQRLEQMDEFQSLSSDQQDSIRHVFAKFVQQVEQYKLIAMIRDALRRFEESQYRSLLSQITAWSQPVLPVKTVQDDAGVAVAVDQSAVLVVSDVEPQIEYVPSRSVRVSFEKAWLANEGDVDQYVEAMRVALLEEIRKGKRVQI